LHDLREEGCGDEVEMHVVLPQYLWVLYAGSFFDTREGFKSVFGTDWEIEKELARELYKVWRSSGVYW